MSLPRLALLFPSQVDMWKRCRKLFMKTGVTSPGWETKCQGLHVSTATIFQQLDSKTDLLLRRWKKKSWRLLNKSIDAVPPRNQDEVLHVSLWWTTHFRGARFGYSLTRASFLFRRGLRCIGDVWDLHRGTFKSWLEVQQTFGEEEVNYLHDHATPFSWNLLITATEAVVTEWVGIFTTATDDLPSLVLCNSEDFLPSVSHEVAQVQVPEQCVLSMSWKAKENLLGHSI